MYTMHVHQSSCSCILEHSPSELCGHVHVHVHAHVHVHCSCIVYTPSSTHQCSCMYIVHYKVSCAFLFQNCVVSLRLTLPLTGGVLESYCLKSSQERYSSS